MCLGIPMQVEQVSEGRVWVRATAEDALQVIETALIGTPKVGDWLLVFLGSAREVLSVERVAEIRQAQALIAQAMTGSYQTDTAVDFALPSHMSQSQLQQLLGLG